MGLCFWNYDNFREKISLVKDEMFAKEKEDIIKMQIIYSFLKL